MHSVTDSTSIDSPNTEWAGVAAGSKMLVGDSADPLPARRDEEADTASNARSEISSPLQRCNDQTPGIARILTLQNDSHALHGLLRH